MHPRYCQSTSHSSGQQGLSAGVSILLVPVVKKTPLPYLILNPLLSPLLSSSSDHSRDGYGPRVSRVCCYLCWPYVSTFEPRLRREYLELQLNAKSFSPSESVTTQIKLLLTHWEAVATCIKRTAYFIFLKGTRKEVSVTTG